MVKLVKKLDQSFDKLRIDPEQSRMGQEFYQCEGCGFQYTEKEWSEKCEAWCREHKTCNLEITARSTDAQGGERGRTTHAVKSEDFIVNENTKNQKIQGGSKFLTRIFYSSIGVIASLVLFLIFYWGLRLDSSISSFINNTYGVPLYFWPYVVLTFGAIILFGINTSLLIYRWRKFGPPKLRGREGTALGSLTGVLASACPVCGASLLSAIGIAGGLAAFPFQGLELKALSFGLMALPVWLVSRDLKKGGCENGVCPIPRDPVLKKTEKPLLLASLILVAALAFGNGVMLKSDPAIAKLGWLQGNKILNQGNNNLPAQNISESGNELFNEIVAKVLPEKGFQSKIYLGDSILKLAAYGVIDQKKFEEIYEKRGGLPTEIKEALSQPSQNPILLTRENASYYVNLLWPLGLANYMSANEESPVKGESLFNFASTGGWTLGKEKNGGAYFNKFRVVELTPGQEQLVTKIAQNTYRPCCNNSTFFQDCNHGSALLGLFELGVSQGLTEEELYREAIAFNSFWFPNNYIQTALYFKAVKNTDWENIDPKEVMGKDFSTASGWAGNVAKKVKELGLVPQKQTGPGCGI